MSLLLLSTFLFTGTPFSLIFLFIILFTFSLIIVQFFAQCWVFMCWVVYEWPIVGLMESKKTSLMTTYKCLGFQIWQMNLLWPMDPPGTRAEIPWIPVHKTWQMNLLWPMDPPLPQQRCLEYQYTILGRWTYFGWWTPHYQSRDAFNTSKQNLADEPTLANGPPIIRAEMPWILVHNTWQMNLLWPMDPPM